MPILEDILCRLIISDRVRLSRLAAAAAGFLSLLSFYYAIRVADGFWAGMVISILLATAAVGFWKLGDWWKLRQLLRKAQEGMPSRERGFDVVQPTDLPFLPAPMKAFGVRFCINNLRHFDELRKLYAEIRRDKDAGTFRDAGEWVGWMPDEVKAAFQWPTDDERARWLSVRDATPIAIPNPDQQLGQRWDFYALFEAIENADYAILRCEQTTKKVGELQINPHGYPYGGVGPLIALVEAFGFDVLGVNECGRFEGRAELLRRQLRITP